MEDKRTHLYEARITGQSENNAVNRAIFLLRQEEDLTRWDAISKLLMLGVESVLEKQLQEVSMTVA